MKKFIVFLFVIMLSGCAIQTEVEYVVDQETKDKIHAQLLEELKEELKVSYQPSLTEVEDMIQSLVEHNDKAIIGVSNYKREGLSDFRLAGTGSGFIYDYDGEFYYAITNAHVVDEADRVVVVLENGKEITVDRILGSQIYVADAQSDIAVIKFKYEDELLKAVEFSDSDEVRKGQFAIAMGNPLGYTYFGSVTLGVVSGLSRGVPIDYDDDGVIDWTATLIQHDVAISPGNSGGPLFDLSGKVIGVNNMKVVSGDVSNIGFAIPGNIAYDIAEALRVNGKIERVSLGVIVNTGELPTGVEYGVWITGIAEGGSVEGTGVQINDVIIRYNDIEIRDFNDLRAALDASKVGEVIDLTVLRAGVERTFSVTLKARAN